MTSPEPAEAVRAGNRARGPGVIGLATTCALDRNGNYGSAELSIVPAAPNALAFVSEGFCPNCRVPLAGDYRNWCPSCEACWHVTREPS